jgi:predicted outer membrane protein
MKRPTRLPLLAVSAVAALLALPVAQGAAQEEEPVEPLEVAVHRVVVPGTEAKLFANGLRVRASCNQDCLLFAKAKVSQETADEIGLSNRVVGTAVREAPAGVKRWLRVQLTKRAKRALADSDTSGARFEVRVRALP